MNTVTCKIPCGVLETESQTIKSGQDKRNWAQYSQAIAVIEIIKSLNENEQ